MNAQSSPPTGETTPSLANSEPSSQHAQNISKRRPLPQWLKLWSSYRVAFWTMVLMAWATWLGTLYQDKHGLLAAQDRYFSSWAIMYPKDIHVVHLFGEPALGEDVGLFSSHYPQQRDQFGELLPTQEKYPILALILNDIQKLRTPFFPGGLLLMTVLSINLLGGVVRIFWQWNMRKIGALTGHLGVLILMSAGAVSHLYKREGFLEIGEGKTNSVVRSFVDPVIEIREETPEGKLSSEAFQTTPEQLRSLFRMKRSAIESQEAQLILNDPALPFVLDVLAAAENVVPTETPSSQSTLVGGKTIDGTGMVAIPNRRERAENFSGAMVVLKPRNGNEPTKQFLLFESSAVPARMEVDGRIFWIDLKHESWQLPFSVRLDDAKSSTHPGTQIARSFESFVTRIDPQGGPTAHHIEMNKPMRKDGFTLFQARMSEQDSTGGMTSTFEVVQNPSDKWPEIACWVIAAGLCIHFSLALGQGLTKAQSRKNSAS